MKSYLFTALLFSLILIGMGCSDAGSGNSSQETGMKEFTDDSSFRNAHERPESAVSVADGERISFPTPDDSTGEAFYIDVPDEQGVLFVFHEWWGLNDHIRNESAKWADSLGKVDVYALDLYDGRVTSDPDTAGKYVNMVDDERAKNIIRGALQQTGDLPVMTIGWCFGGGWSLKASVEAGSRGQAGVMYYGMPVKEEKQLEGLEADILGLFARQDDWITPEVVKEFDALMKKTGHSFQYEIYDAKHAFANPSRPVYKENAAQLANAKALAFLRKHMQEASE